MSLPLGFTVRLAPGVLRKEGGRLLVGGSPLTVLRLSDRALTLLDQSRLTVTDRASEGLASRLLATNLAYPELKDLDSPRAEDVTVVVPVRDRDEQLDRLLRAVRPLRCIVVDDASADAGAIKTIAAQWNAELVRLSVNLGPAGARNAGLARVRSPYVAFVDSDVEISGESLLTLGRHLADPAVALVGPRVIGTARSLNPRWYERYDESFSSLELGTTPASVSPGAAVAWLPSACLIGRTGALGEGFDADLRVGEDVDLVWRLLDKGWSVRYAPEVVASHDARATLRSWLGRKAFYGSGGGALATRHGSHLAPAILTPTYAVAAVAVLLRRRWSWPVAASALAAGAVQVHRALPETEDKVALSTRLAARGLTWAVQQESALLLRHWWPVAALGVAVSSSVRRAAVSALLVDAAVSTARPGGGAPLASVLVGRRLDDLAYGAGLWFGTVRARAPRALMPRRPRTWLSSTD